MFTLSVFFGQHDRTGSDEFFCSPNNANVTNVNDKTTTRLFTKSKRSLRYLKFRLQRPEKKKRQTFPCNCANVATCHAMRKSVCVCVAHRPTQYLLCPPSRGTIPPGSRTWDNFATLLTCEGEKMKKKIQREYTWIQ